MKASAESLDSDIDDRQRMPVLRSHTFPKMQRKTFYDSRELSFIDEMTDDEEAQGLGRPPYEGYVPRRKKDRAKNLKQRLSKLFDGLEDPKLVVNPDPNENFERVVENFRRSMIASDDFDVYAYQPDPPEPEVTETTKLLDDAPDSKEKSDSKPNGVSDIKAEKTNGTQPQTQAV